MIAISEYPAEVLCGGLWTDCVVLGVTDDEQAPMSLVSFEDDEGCEALLWFSRVRRIDG